MKYNLEKTKELFNKGGKLKFLFFWGHTPNKDGSVGKNCFSQWWNAVFIVDGVRYKTAEHYMMAGKAKLFEDEEMLAKIISCTYPMEAKQLGRKVKNFDPTVWNEYKYQIVKEANYHKFSQHEDLKEFLLNTKNRVLVEASPRDRIWGIGMG